MNFKYDQPLVLQSGPQPLEVVKIKHGVTEISLSDGRIIRVSFHIDGVSGTADQLNVNYSVISEVMPEPPVAISDVHESLQ